MSEALDSPFRARKYSDIASQLIRDRIMSGEFAPGERINEIMLSEQLKISRSPLREALRDLSAEGLVTMVAGRGAFVAKLDVDAIRHLGELRLALESFSARVAAKRADEEARARLTSVMHAVEAVLSNSSQTYPHQLDFHKALGLATANPRLAQVADEVERQLRLARAARGGAPDRARQVYLEHKLIYDAVMARDADAAETAMRAHIEASTNSIIELMTAEGD